MNPKRDFPVRPRRDRQSGQALVLMGLLLVGLLSMTALVIDMGDLYYSYQQLLGTTTAAAMAGGSAIPAGTAVSTAYSYSGDPNSPANATYNVRSNLNVTAVTPTLGCISTATYPNLGLPPCIAYGAQAAANAIQVTETARVPMYFAKIFGVSTVNIRAVATASAKGGGAGPYDIMMVLDTTASMDNTDPGCTVPGIRGSPTAEACAQYGVQQLLSELDPCPTTMSSCGTVNASGNVATPVDRVGLMVFPGLCSSTTAGLTTATCPSATSLTNTTANSTYAPLDYGCGASHPNPPIAAYNNNPAYLIVPLGSDYRSSDTASGLNGGSTGSKLVRSVGAGLGSCPGADDPGGEGTFYAGAIQAASDYLWANARQNVQGVIILLSDGDATANSTQMGGSVTTYRSSGECTQAGTAATNAKARTNPLTPSLNTLFYSVSYGSSTTGCTDGGESAGYTNPCSSMKNMASLPSSQYFFSVPKGSGGTTVCAGARPVTDLDQVFTDIAGDLTTSRLLPNSTF